MIILDKIKAEIETSPLVTLEDVQRAAPDVLKTLSPEERLMVLIMGEDGHSGLIEVGTPEYYMMSGGEGFIANILQTTVRDLILNGAKASAAP